MYNTYMHELESEPSSLLTTERWAMYINRNVTPPPALPPSRPPRSSPGAHHIITHHPVTRSVMIEDDDRHILTHPHHRSVLYDVL